MTRTNTPMKLIERDGKLRCPECGGAEFESLRYPFGDGMHLTKPVAHLMVSSEGSKLVFPPVPPRHSVGETQCAHCLTKVHQAAGE
jgi:hypothetical protein